VEDVLYAYASKLKVENPAHSFIIDTSDNNVKDLFTKTKWEERRPLQKCEHTL